MCAAKQYSIRFLWHEICQLKWVYNYLLISDTHREKLCFTQFIVEEFIEIETSLLLTFSRCLHNELSSILSIVQGRRNGFQSGGAMEHWKGMSATMVGRQEKCSNSRRSRMAKTVTFWPWWQPFNSFCFETLFSFFPLFSFCYEKKLCLSGGESRPCCLIWKSTNVWKRWFIK